MAPLLSSSLGLMFSSCRPGVEAEGRRRGSWLTALHFHQAWELCGLSGSSGWGPHLASPWGVDSLDTQMWRQTSETLLSQWSIFLTCCK